jgi:hypothetical protein
MSQEDWRDATADPTDRSTRPARRRNRRSPSTQASEPGAATGAGAGNGIKAAALACRGLSLALAALGLIAAVAHPAALQPGLTIMLLALLVAAFAGQR